MKFTYGSGQKPLDGYTIKRGVGKGGFGEVYFAVSDGGKEVALKLLRGDSGIELRGIAHCINLKHPNLVAVYDLRSDKSGDQWVVMEYVAGEPLQAVLERHPTGLPIELAREWFLALSRAVGYLHDHGVVHRDLKPANVFIEEGVLKVGDYGLCKSMSASQRTPQTQSVGTVHYMAPEISTGNYNKQIDIYACGVLLYEMVSGQLPFEGETPGEVLMKHLTSTPNLDAVPPDYRPLIAKALAKDPAQRFTAMSEMSQAVEALSRPAASPSPPKPAATKPTEGVPPIPMVLDVESGVQPNRGMVGELTGSMGAAAVLALLTTTFWTAIGGKSDWHWIGTTYFLTVAVCWAVLIPTKFWAEQAGTQTWSRRLMLMISGAGVGLLALWLDGWDFGGARNGSTLASLPGVHRDAVAQAAGYLSYYTLCLGLVRWWRFAERQRKSWFSLFPVIAAGFWAVVLTLPLLNFDEGVSARAIVAVITSAAVVQFVSPHEPPPARLPRRLRYRAA